MNELPDPSKLFFSERDAAIFLGIPPETLVRWRRERIGPAYSDLGSRVVYTRDDILDFMCCVAAKHFAGAGKPMMHNK